MARFVTKSAGTDPSSLVTAGVVALGILLFTAIVAWPSSAPKVEPPLNAADTAIGAKLDDPLTHSFLETLHQVDPEQSRLLHETAEIVLAEGGTAADLALEIVAIYGINPFKDFEYLAQADIKYIEKMISLGQSELSALSFAKSKYCQLATYEAYDHMQSDAITDELSQAFGYNTRAYKWILRFGIVQMQAIQDGRSKPKKYERLNQADTQDLQESLMRLMQTRALNQLMSQNHRDQQAWKNAAKTMDMCEIGAEVLAAANKWPPELKGRVLVEMQRLRKKGAIKALSRELFGDSCGVCTSIF
ncbi:MAG: hypothetical protein AAGL97_08840 [Pseudomonadota bacterium]